MVSFQFYRSQDAYQKTRIFDKHYMQIENKIAILRSLSEPATVMRDMLDEVPSGRS